MKRFLPILLVFVLLFVSSCGGGSSVAKDTYNEWKTELSASGLDKGYATHLRSASLKPAHLRDEFGMSKVEPPAFTGGTIYHNSMTPNNFVFAVVEFASEADAEGALTTFREGCDLGVQICMVYDVLLVERAGTSVLVVMGDAAPAEALLRAFRKVTGTAG